MDAWLGGVTDLGIATYYPMVRELRRVPRNELSRSQRTADLTLMRWRIVPFLPYLVFVEAAARHLIDRRYPGMAGWLSVGEEPAIVADTVIAALRLREHEGGGAIPGGTPVEHIFHVGDRVRIIHGPLTDQQGLVAHPPDVPLERIDADTRLRLILDHVGAIDLPVGDVAKTVGCPARSHG